jgi:hypothetical protein
MQEFNGAIFRVVIDLEFFSGEDRNKRIKQLRQGKQRMIAQADRGRCKISGVLDRWA